MRTKLTCNGCRALEVSGPGSFRCALRKEIAQNSGRPYPRESCPKPKTVKALVDCEAALRR